MNDLLAGKSIKEYFEAQSSTFIPITHKECYSQSISPEGSKPRTPICKNILNEHGVMNNGYCG